MLALSGAALQSHTRIVPSTEHEANTYIHRRAGGKKGKTLGLWGGIAQVDWEEEEEEEEGCKEKRPAKRDQGCCSATKLIDSRKEKVRVWADKYTPDNDTKAPPPKFH